MTDRVENYPAQEVPNLLLEAANKYLHDKSTPAQKDEVARVIECVKKLPPETIETLCMLGDTPNSLYEIARAVTNSHILTHQEERVALLFIPGKDVPPDYFQNALLFAGANPSEWAATEYANPSGPNASKVLLITHKIKPK